MSVFLKGFITLAVMITIAYPLQKPQIKKENEQEFIFCIIRKRWFIITPEEWVRQNFLLYLIRVLQYPAALIAVEKQLLLSEVKKRFDIVVYKNTTPYIIVECKEMNVPLQEATIMQVLNYNSIVQAPIMIITNGSYCAAYLRDNNSFVEIDEIPDYKN
jgi:hypothetical protein